MRIIYLTDVHGSFDNIKTLLQETVADVYIIAGDLIDIPFYSMETAIKYHEIQSSFHALRRRMDRQNMIIEDFVDEIINDPSSEEPLIESAMEYQQYTIRARRVMQQKYKLLENICSMKGSSQVFALPGNYDMDLKYTSLHGRDLHLHWYQLDNCRVAGYGGADVFTAGIPERYIVHYNGGIGKSDSHNEMYTFFRAVKPDIIVAHQPPHGIHDRLSYKGPSGSPALRTYCDNNEVKLCLTGHIHGEWGFLFSDNTVFLNPSNFGEVTMTTGEVAEGGFFYQIEMKNSNVEKVVFKKLVENRVYDLIDYFPVKNKWQENIIDNERVEALRKTENYDMKMKKYSHIPEIQLYNDIRSFFRSFQTQETDIRIEVLEKVAEMLEGHFDSVAFDVVGSVNFGLSQPMSDLDFVLYMRCDKDCSDMKGNCPSMNEVNSRIENLLQGKFKFQIIDCVNLNLVEQSIKENNYECEATQRFLTHRLMGRPINYRVMAPVEDMLNENMEFRKEIEGSIQSFFKIFTNTSQHVQSFYKYELRLKSLGIKIPEAIREKIRSYFHISENEE
jgi:Icc-related predicted phosphoesterase